MSPYGRRLKNEGPNETLDLNTSLERSLPSAFRTFGSQKSKSWINDTNNMAVERCSNYTLFPLRSINSSGILSAIHTCCLILAIHLRSITCKSIFRVGEMDCTHTHVNFNLVFFNLAIFGNLPN